MKVYLGDSVYVQFTGYSIVLTTNNGYEDDPRNTIVLEEETYSALLKFVEHVTKPNSASSPASIE